MSWRGVRRTGAACAALALLAACGNAGPVREPDPSAQGGSPTVRSEQQGAVDADALASRLAPCPETQPASGEAESDGAERLPEVTLACLGAGDDVRLAGLRGQPTVINVWATWCGPCKEEAPYFQSLHETAGDEVRVLGIDYDDAPAERALAFADALGLRYAQVADPEATLRAPLGLSIGIPATLFVDAKGRVVERVHKPYRDAAELFADVRTYLGVAA